MCNAITCCARGIIKYLVFAFNLVFVVAGLALLVIGIMYKLNFDDALPSDVDFNLSAAPILLITVGAITLVIAFLGCCGAVKESSCMLTTYGIVLLVLLILQFAAGVYAFVSIQEGTNSLKIQVNKYSEKLFDDYDNGGESKEYVDTVQQWLSCCGFNGKTDWPQMGIPIPPSCCEDEDALCSEEKAFDKPCVGVLYGEIENMLKVIGYVAITLCSTELLAIIFSFCLCCSKKS